MLRNLYSPKSRLSLVLAVAAILVVAGFDPEPAAAQSLTAESVKRSVWDTAYVTKGGKQIPARVCLSGASGWYDTPEGRARLSNVQYFIDQDPASGQFVAQVTGRWHTVPRFGGNVGGTFQFMINNTSRPFRMEGVYQIGNNGQDLQWNGNFVGLER